MRKLLFFCIAIVFFSVNAMSQGCSEPVSEEGVNIFGYVQAQYDYNMFDETESTFGFNRARLVLWEISLTILVTMFY